MPKDNEDLSRFPVDGLGNLDPSKYDLGFVPAGQGDRRTPPESTKIPLGDQPTFQSIEELHRILSEMAAGKAPTHADIAHITDFPGKRATYKILSHKEVISQDFKGDGYERVLLQENGSFSDNLWSPDMSITNRDTTVYFMTYFTAQPSNCETISLNYGNRGSGSYIKATIGINPDTQDMHLTIKTNMYNFTPEERKYLVQPNHTSTLAYGAQHDTLESINPLQFFITHPPR